MLHASQLLKFMWGEAMKHTLYLKERNLIKALNGMTPYEAFYSRKPDLVGLHEFNKPWSLHGLVDSLGTPQTVFHGLHEDSPWTPYLIKAHYLIKISVKK